MQATIDLSVVFSDHMNCDLQVMCGPRYNSFGPARRRHEEVGKFFEKSTSRDLVKRPGKTIQIGGTGWSSIGVPPMGKPGFNERPRTILNHSSSAQR